MKTKFIISFIMILCYVINGWTQSEKTAHLSMVDGYVTETDSVTPIDFVTVQLYALPDSSFIKGTTTGTGGHFALNVPGGTYFFKLSSVGYTTRFLNFNVDSVQIRLGKIPLSITSTMLKGMEVVAQTPAVVQKGDTTTYNASSFRVAEGSMLDALIKKLPGAEIDENGNLTINGQKITKVMMDGEEFFINDLNAAMKDIPAEMIDKLQVYHRKSDNARATGIDDGNDDLVLDLRVKPDRKQGWNGNAMVGYGNDGQWQGQLQANRFKSKMNFSMNGSADDNGITRNKRMGLNYSKRTDKLNIGASVNFNRSDNHRWNISDTETFVTDSTSQYSHSESNSKNFRNSLTTNLRMEWRPDTLTTITFRPQISYNKGEDNGTSSSWTQNDAREMLNRKEGNSPRTYHGFSTSGNLYVNRRLGKPGRNVSLNFSYNVNTSKDEAMNRSDTYYMMYGDSVQIRNQYIPTTNNSHELNVQLTYTEPLFKNHYLKLDYSFRNRPSVYERYAYNWNEEESRFYEFPDSAQSRCTENKYNIQRANLSFVANTKKYNYTLGVNVEAQRYSTRNYFENVTVTSQARTVVNYAPSFNLRYKFSDNASLRMDYRGNSSQPSLNDLQPITDNTDPLNIRTGNPNLKPGFNNNVSLNFSQSFPKRRSNINFYGRYANQMNRVAWVVDYDETTGVRKNYPRNVNGNWQMELGLNSYVPLGKITKSKFSISTNSRYNFSRSVGFIRAADSKSSLKNFTRGTTLYQELKGNLHLPRLDFGLSANIRYFTSNNSLRHESDRSTYDYGFRANLDATLFWDIQFSSDVNCTLRRGYGGKNDKTRTMWNAQISKSFFKRKSLVVRFNVYDILKENEIIGHSVSEYSVSDWSRSSARKYYMFSLTYKFNKFGVSKRPASKKNRTP